MDIARLRRLLLTCLDLGLLMLGLVCCGDTDPGRNLEHFAQPFADPSDSLPPSQGLALPRPTEAIHSVAYVGEDDRSCHGYDWEISLPRENINGGSMQPTWDGSGSPSLETSSFAIFTLGELAGHAGPPRIELGFDPSSYPVPDSSELFIALGNFQTDRWDWFACVGQSSYFSYEAYQFNFGSFTPYLAPAGELLCLVLLQQGDTCELDWVLAGANASPSLYVGTDLNSDPKQNIGPLTVQFTCVGDTYGGPLLGYDFDWEGDGTWDLLGNTDGLAAHEYQPGVYTCLVRVADNSGLSTIEEEKFIIIDPNNTLPVAFIDSNVLGGSAPLSVTLDASASTDDKPLSRFQWDLDSDGDFEHETTEPYLDVVMACYGSKTITIRVTDQDLAMDEASTVINVLDGWDSVVVANVWPSDMEAVTCGSGLGRRPCLLYVSDARRKLSFVRGGNGGGESWNAPVLLLDLNEDFIEEITVVEDSVLNRPVAAWVQFSIAAGVRQLWTSYALNDACTDWSVPLKVHEHEFLEGGCTLAVSGNKPRLVFATREAPGVPAEIHLLRGHDSKGSAWEQLFSVASNVDLTVGELAMISSGADLVLAASGTEPGGGWNSSKTMVWHTLGGDPTAWSGEAQTLSYAANDLDLTLIDGQPAMVMSYGSDTSMVHYVRSLDSLGSAWPASAVEVGVGTSCALCNFDGQTCVLYNDSPGNRVTFTRCADPNGGAWSLREPVAIDTSFGNELALTMNLGRPFIFYLDPDSSKLRCASWRF